MFELYLFCLILGGGLLGFSLLTGGDHSTDIHGSIDINADTGHSLDLHSSDDITHIDIHSGEITETNKLEISKNDSADSIKLLSFRNIVYFISFFGLTGITFSLLLFSFLITFFCSLSMGGFAAWFGYKLMKYLVKSESGQSINISELIGKQAFITVNVSKNRKGKIQTNCKGQSIELSALIDDSSDVELFKMREKVLIINIKNNIAFIVSFDF